MRRVALAVGWLGLAACAVPYRPAQARLNELPDDAFERVLEVVRAGYTQLVVADAQGFRIQSEWLPHDDPRAGQKRATVYLEGGDRISVVVETRYLGLDLLGNPSWSRARGDRRLERELLELVVQALGRESAEAPRT